MAVILPGMFGALSSPFMSEALADRILETGSGVISDGLLVYAAMPNFVCESVVLRNCGQYAVDLKGWTVTDGEGWLTFSVPRVLGPGMETSLCSNASVYQRLTGAAGSIEFCSSELARKGRFALADDGDEVSLLHPDGSIADRLYYGSAEPQPPGWIGTTVARPSSGSMLMRQGGDSDTASDWAAFVPGRQTFGPFEDVAYVEPFLCPEQMRDRLVREFRHSQFSISIAIYEIGDGAVGHELLDARERGVAVRILVEAQPVGGVPQHELELLDSLNASGCEIHVLKSYDGYRGYDYLHCKYAIIDSRRVVVTSENWMQTSLSSNRGWGASIEDPRLASRFLQVFEADFDLERLDVQNYVQADPDPPVPFGPSDPGSSEIAAVEAVVEAIFSPTSSILPIRSLVQNATSRILIELMYLEPNMLTSGGLVADVLHAAARGVSVRILLDGGYYATDECGDNRVAMDYVTSMVPPDSDIMVGFSTPYHDFGLIHNKGLVVDDTAVVSSINWGVGPFERNREAALLIESEVVADFFASSFQGDWQPDRSVPSIAGVPESVRMERAGPLTLDARNCTDPAGIASYEWDLGADGSVDWRGPVCYFDIGGPTTIRLTVRDSFGNRASMDVDVEIEPTALPAEDGMPLFACAFAACLGLWIIRKRIKSSRALAMRHASQDLSDEGPRSGLHPGHEGPQRDVLNHRVHRHLKLLARRIHRAGAGHGHRRVHLRDNDVPERGAHPHAGGRGAVAHERPGQHPLPRVRPGVRREGDPQHKPGGADQQPPGHTVLPEGRVPDRRTDRQVLHERRGRL